MYEEEVLNLIDNLFKKYDKLVMTGGSGLYIDAVRFGIDDFPKTDPAIRAGLQKQFDTEGIESLRKNLRFLDPETYKKIDLKNPKRIQKALEVCISTGKPYSSFLTSYKKQRNFKISMIVINREREELYNLINERVLLMMEKGLEKEAENLFQFRHLNALNTVGYRELFDYFEGKINLEEAITRIQSNTRNYARKQLTWFKKDDSAKWLHPEQWGEIMKIVKKNPQENQ
jgi:tRNA dimethylallyltransferase